tara:strand:+ start:830 stop:1765 length:936 start_codon:yes stop_codon:yes gene_type:complete
MIDALKPLIKQFLPFAQEKMGFEHPPRLFVRQDADNAANPLGKTAYYDPEASSVTLYITDRHPKDVMRSLSHELVHHTQHGNGEFENVGEMGEGYAQNNPHMREMERQAYEIGNLCFRDWEDSIKGTIYNEHLQKGVEKNMSTKDWKNGELNSLLLEKWGFKFDLDRLDEKTGDIPDRESAKKSIKGKGTSKEESDDLEQQTENCGPDMGGDEAEVMVVGDEGPEEAAAPEERAVELVDELRALLMQLTGGVEGEEMMEEEEPDLEEKRARGRPGPHTRGAADPRARGLGESQVRQLVRTALKRVMEKKNG